MSFTETKTPQKHKEFNPKYTQDHGSSAGAKGHETVPDWIVDKRHSGKRKADAEVLNQELAELQNLDLTGLSPDELEREADKLLGVEYSTETKKSVNGAELPTILQMRSVIENSVAEADEVEATDLLDKYEGLYEYREDLVSVAELLEAGDDLDDTIARIAATEDQLAGIEEELVAIVNDNDPFTTEAELGIKSKREVKKAMARRVMIDVVHEVEDDYGDSDYDVPVRISNTLK